MDAGDRLKLTAYGGDGAQDKAMVNRIMFRFRPIAPKPLTGGSASGGTVPENNSKLLLPVKRAKRKYVRIRRNSGYRRKSRKSSEQLDEQNGLENDVVTLQLMPEKTELKEGSVAGDSWCKNVDLDLTVDKIEIQDNRELEPPTKTLLNIKASSTVDDNVGEKLDRAVLESWVTVESVTDTCMDAGGLGCTDVEKVKNLESDTCPGFISDGYSRVWWVNDAYRRMVSKQSEGEGQPSPEIVVWLHVKDNLLYSHRAFTCGVRLQYAWQKEKCTKMVPCDVWRLDSGGFAWRLDTKAALSLGL
ncbi:hypothetical protein L6164_004997 [Bauhinia variegata]|uniref:Uncharacterized protein n=1 Tax=Bauhinia variegata TaxID=167791 RepID=A0ACB9PQG9_BAUVA|nr:hypothetical protein L6164_004997 [Bauhinia variegata]